MGDDALTDAVNRSGNPSTRPLSGLRATTFQRFGYQCDRQAFTPRQNPSRNGHCAQCPCDSRVVGTGCQPARFVEQTHQHRKLVAGRYLRLHAAGAGIYSSYRATTTRTLFTPLPLRTIPAAAGTSALIKPTSNGFPNGLWTSRRQHRLSFFPDWRSCMRPGFGVVRCIHRYYIGEFGVVRRVGSALVKVWACHS